MCACGYRESDKGNVYVIELFHLISVQTDVPSRRSQNRHVDHRVCLRVHRAGDLIIVKSVDVQFVLHKLLRRLLVEIHRNSVNVKRVEGVVSYIIEHDLDFTGNRIEIT